MIKIINEIGGKKYELVSGKCSNCDLHGIKTDICRIHPTDNTIDGKILCAALHGVWKEVKDED